MHTLAIGHCEQCNFYIVQINSLCLKQHPKEDVII